MGRSKHKFLEAIRESLVLYAKTIAYWGATPKDKQKSRLEELHDNSLSDVDMPEIDEAFDYLRGLFFDMGQASSTGMGLTSITWQEFRAWRTENKLYLTIWEKETLKKMSDAYSNEYNRASDPRRQPPYQQQNTETPDEELQIQKAIAMRNAMRSLRKKS